MKEFNINAKEALKLMLKGKTVISINGGMFFYHNNLDKIIVNENVKMYITYEDIFLSYKALKYKEYIEPKKPRKFEFEAFIGENPNNKMIFDNSCTDQAFGYYTSYIYRKKEPLLDDYKIISKFKITMQEILE
jgi:hypothetical protein